MDAVGIGADRLKPLLALAMLPLLWQAAAWIAQSPVLPGPVTVAAALWREAMQGPLLHHLGVSLARVAVCLVLALGVGASLGLASGRSGEADLWLRPWLIALLNLPALVIIILVYVWLGLTEAALIVAVVLTKIPNLAVIVREGASRLDGELDEMAALYRFGTWRRLRHVVLPQLAPFLFAALRSGLSLCWKMVLLAELLGRSSGIGFQLQTYFQIFDVPRILAYAAAFGIVVLAIEYGALAPLERRSNRWRR